jgi:hypothetical protein
MNQSIVAVNDQVLVVECGYRQVRDTHNSRDTKRSGDDCGVGKGGTLCRDNTA